MNSTVTNCLAIISGPCDATHRQSTLERVIGIMRELRGDGATYLYVAIDGQKKTEDRPDQVRLLPLHPDRLPGFGQMDTVLVVGCPSLNERAAQEYPKAAIISVALEEAAPQVTAFPTEEPALPLQLVA